jgi:predicted transposase YdaD
MLISSFSYAFAGWLLDAPVQEVIPLNVELPASTIQSDMVFDVILADGQRVLLHIEQQGRRSEYPMPWRMLEYMSRLSVRELGDRIPDHSVRLHSVVFYTGAGAGLNDAGVYRLLGLGESASLEWRYQPIRLWQMEPEMLLALGEPAFLPLVGQTHLDRPEQVIPKVLEHIRGVEGEETRGRLLTALAGLMSSQEVLEMVEKMLDATENTLLDTPYLRRIREQGREMGLNEGKQLGLSEGKEIGLSEGKQIGLSEGKQIGLSEGKQIGLSEGKQIGLSEGLQEAILDTIAFRYDPPTHIYRYISQRLAGITDRQKLRDIQAAAIQAEDMAAFTARLDEILGA